MPRRTYVPPPTMLPTSQLPGVTDKAVREPLQGALRQIATITRHIRNNATPADSPAPAGPTNVQVFIVNGLFRVVFRADRSGPLIQAYRIYRAVGASTNPALSECVASLAAVDDETDLTYEFQDQDIDSSGFSVFTPGSVSYWVRSFDDRNIASVYVPAPVLAVNTPVGHAEQAAFIALMQAQIGYDVTLAGDVSNSTTSYADVTALSIPLVSGRKTWFEFLIPYTSAAATTGSRWSVNGSVAATALYYRSEYTLTATSQTVNYASAYDTPAAANASSLTTGNLARISGMIIPSGDGTLIARFASEVGASAITAKAGATVRYRYL